MWKKRGNARTYDEFVLEKTGKDRKTFRNVSKKYNIRRLDEIAAFIKEASVRKIKITVVGDYDADGICSLLILAKLLKRFQVRFELITPKRISEGYGLSPKIMERITEGIVLTIDNGIAACEAIRIAKNKGLPVIIMDHHMQGEVLPNADIIVDPSAFPDTADFAYYCGAGLAYKLAEIMLPAGDEDLKIMSGFAAIATIGDSVSLTEDNRRIVIEGIQNLKSGFYTEGTNLLLEQCRFDAYTTSTDIAFNIVPCINAPGRLLDDGAKKVVQALWTNNRAQATPYVDELLALNQQRKDIIEKILNDMDVDKLRADTDNCVFYFGEDLPEGVAGLLAGKFANETNKPSVVLVRTENGIIKGSCRLNEHADESTNLKEVLDGCKDLFIRYGGHRAAAAVQLEEKNLEAFHQQFRSLLPVFVVDDSQYYDLEINASELEAMAEQLEEMEPFGNGNPKPILCIRNIKVGNNYGETISYMGKEKQHIRLNFKAFKAVGFHMAERLKEIYPNEEEPQYVNLYGYAEFNFFNGKKYLQFRLVDFEKSA